MAFIPTLWSNELLVQLRSTLVYGNIVNRNYEGLIKFQGDSVKISSMDDVDVTAYTKNQKLPDPQLLAGTDQSLLIDQANFFQFRIDDIDQAQQNPKLMAEAMQSAAYGIRSKADAYIAGLYTGVAAGNTIGDDAAPVAVTAANAYEQLVKLSTILKKNNVPVQNRFVVVPPEFYGLLLQDQRFVGAGSAMTDSVIQTGYIGMVNGLKVFESNEVPVSGGNFKIMAGHPVAITYAEQVLETEVIRSENYFANIGRGLHVYGAKLVRPDAIAVLTASIQG